MEELPCRQFRENKIMGMQAVVLGVMLHGLTELGELTQRPGKAWFKEKVILVEALESGMVLDEEYMAFLVDNMDTITTGQQSQEIPTPAAFQTDDLDAFDSDCVEAPSASAVPMAKLSLYDSEVLSEVPIHNNYLDNHVIDQNVREMQYSE
ncbi:hypothetical protein Tco_0787687 [Tanacetum coccineum]